MGLMLISFSFDRRWKITLNLLKTTGREIRTRTSLNLIYHNPVFCFQKLSFVLSFFVILFCLSISFLKDKTKSQKNFSRLSGISLCIQRLSLISLSPMTTIFRWQLTHHQFYCKIKLCLMAR